MPVKPKADIFHAMNYDHPMSFDEVQMAFASAMEGDDHDEVGACLKTCGSCGATGKIAVKILFYKPIIQWWCTGCKVLAFEVAVRRDGSRN